MPLKGQKILIVDDEPKSLTHIKDILTEAGARVHTACDGSRALGKMEMTDYNVILFDLIMPITSGLQMIQAARKENLNTKAQFVSLSGNYDPETVTELTKLNISTLLSKPVNANNLVKKIEELIEIPEIKVNNQVLSIFMNAAINCLGTSLDTKAHAFKPSRKSTNLTTGFVVGKIRIKGVVSGTAALSLEHDYLTKVGDKSGLHKEKISNSEQLVYGKKIIKDFMKTVQKALSNSNVDLSASLLAVTNGEDLEVLHSHKENGIFEAHIGIAGTTCHFELSTSS